MSQRFVIKMSDGNGFVEWYRSLAVRMQAESREEARKFASRKEADDFADFIRRNLHSFAGIYLDGGGRIFLEVLPAEENPEEVR